MKSKNKKPLSSYERARKRVDEIKGFYGHLVAYLIVNAVLLLTRGNYSFIFENNGTFGDLEFISAINWQTYGTSLFWGIGLTFHAICVFGKNPFLGKAWEERQILKYMEKE